jgi:hypothetical protein
MSNQRLALIWQILEDLLSQSSLPRDPYLVSRVVAPNLVPISVLASLQPLRKLKASEAEIIQCCTYSYNFEFVHLGPLKAVATHYVVVPAILIVKGIAALGTLSEFGSFLGSLIGDGSFWAYYTNDGADFAVGFQCWKQSLAAWRALKILPFHGQKLEIEVYAPARPYRVFGMQQAVEEESRLKYQEKLS